MWYVYFLQLKNNDIYVGSTNDLKRRFASHQAGQVTSTKQNLPLGLKSYVAVETEALARELERYFKSGSGKAFANRRFMKQPAQSGGRETLTLERARQTPPREGNTNKFPSASNEERARSVLEYYER